MIIISLKVNKAVIGKFNETIIQCMMMREEGL